MINYGLYGFNKQKQTVSVLTKDQFVKMFPSQRNLASKNYEEWIKALNMKKIPNINGMFYFMLNQNVFLFILKDKTKEDLQNYLTKKGLLQPIQKTKNKVVSINIPTYNIMQNLEPFEIDITTTISPLTNVSTSNAPINIKHEEAYLFISNFDFDMMVSYDSIDKNTQNLFNSNNEITIAEIQKYVPESVIEKLKNSEYYKEQIDAHSGISWYIFKCSLN